MCSSATCTVYVWSILLTFLLIYFTASLSEYIFVSNLSHIKYVFKVQQVIYRVTFFLSTCFPLLKYNNPICCQRYNGIYHCNLVTFHKTWQFRNYIPESCTHYICYRYLRYIRLIFNVLKED